MNTAKCSGDAKALKTVLLQVMKGIPAFYLIIKNYIHMDWGKITLIIAILGEITMMGITIYMMSTNKQCPAWWVFIWVLNSFLTDIDRLKKY